MVMGSSRCVAAALLVVAMLPFGCATDARVAVRGDNGLPTPYTAEQIRNANPPGTTIVFRITENGKPVVRQTTRFVSGDVVGCVIEGHVETEDGTPVRERKRSESTWSELRDHAAFPPERARREPAACTVPAGRFECWLYTLEGDADDDPTTSRFYFAHDRPGPPVLYEVERQGVVGFRMELIEDTRSVERPRARGR